MKNSSGHTRKLATQFIRDVYEQYFKNIPKTIQKRWSRLRKRRAEINEQADQDTKNLNEAASSWRERYRPLFNDFSRAITEISPNEIEGLCLALSSKMNTSQQ